MRHHLGNIQFILSGIFFHKEKSYVFWNWKDFVEGKVHVERKRPQIKYEEHSHMLKKVFHKERERTTVIGKAQPTRKTLNIRELLYG